MTKAVETFLAKQSEKVFAFRRALSSESDRGCALFASAYLDQALSDLLYVYFVANKDIEKDLFRGDAPLSTFSARIKVAFYLGKISKETRRDLDLIRAVRNRFAHHPDVVAFEDKFVADRCRELRFSYHDKKADSRAHFTAAVMGILARLQVMTLTTERAVEKADDRPTVEEKEANRLWVEKLGKAIEDELAQKGAS